MRRLLGIVTQITLLMAAVVLAAIYLLFSRMGDSASKVVVEHEKLDLGEETQLQGWQLLHRIEGLCHDTRSTRDALLRLAQDASNAARGMDEQIVARAIPAALTERCLRVEVVPFADSDFVPHSLRRQCDVVSAASSHDSPSRRDILELVRTSVRNMADKGPPPIILSSQLYREPQPFQLTNEAKRRIQQVRQARGEANPVIANDNYHLMWAGAWLPNESRDGGWILLVATGLDETFRGIAGSPRHLGFLFDDRGTAFVQPQCSGLRAQASREASTPSPLHEIFEKPMRGSFVAAPEGQFGGIMLGVGDADARSLIDGCSFYFCETGSLNLSARQLSDGQRLLSEMNNEYLAEEWGLEVGSKVSVRRVSGLQPNLPRIRMMASSPGEFEAMREQIQRVFSERFNLRPGLELKWSVKPVPCRQCYVSQVRVPLPDQTGVLIDSRTANDPGARRPTLTLVRAVFKEELDADLVPELASVRQDLYFGGLFAVAVALGLSLVIVLPLRKITRTARKISAALVGDSHVDVARLVNDSKALPLRRPDEVGDMARALRDLVNRVEEYGIALCKRDALLRGIHDNVMDGIMTIDEAGAVRSFNPAAERIFGWPAEDVLGEHAGMLFPPEVGEKLDRARMRYLHSGQSTYLGTRSEFEGQHRTGTRFPLEMSVSQLGDGGCERTFVALVRNITERRQAEQAQAWRQANEEKSRALREIAHETLGDLTAIVGAADRYRRRFIEGMSPEEVTLLERVEESARSLVDYVERLRDVAHLTSGAVELQLEDFSPREVVEDVLEVLGPKFHESGIRLESKLDGAPAKIQADRSRFRQVVRNLLANACKYTPREGRVTVEARVEEDDLHLEITDTGIGIPAEDRDKLFTVFGRASNADRQATGQGLGLALCKRIVDMHWGEIDFETIVDRGTKFWFRLPIRQRHADALQGSREPEVLSA